MWVWICTNTTLEPSWSNYSSTTPLYSTAKQNKRPNYIPSIRNSSTLGIWRPSSFVLSFQPSLQVPILGIVFTVVVHLPVMRPNLPFISAKHTLVTYNITLSLITKTNQGLDAFNLPLFGDWWQPYKSVRVVCLKFLSIEKMDSYTQ
jgi:hypothetical protein